MNQPPVNTDIWLLAGQSNMAGSGFREPYETPSDRVWLFNLRDEWQIAEEPLWGDRYEAVDDAFAIMRSEIPRATPEYRRQQAVGFREKLVHSQSGAGLGLTFGKAISTATGRPVGLLFCAKGDTRMEEWDPEFNGTPYMALYKATLRRIRQVNRPLTGVLWYQGESDTFDDKGDCYAERLRRLVAALRRDTGQPDLPFFYVQIANCFSQPEAELPQWNLVQELQRQLEPELAPGGLCPAVDLPLGDGIHLSTAGQQRLGRRLAKLVRRQLYDDRYYEIGPRPIAIERHPADPCLVTVRFANVNGRLLPADRVAGFSLIEPGKNRNLVCCARVDAANPTAVRLFTIAPPPAGSQLRYGQGLTCFCNLVDEQDCAAPVFGPWPLSGG